MLSRLFAAALSGTVLALPCAVFAEDGRNPPRLIATGLNVTAVTIETGRLVITGNTPPNTLVTLERRFQTRADANGRFRFALLYTVEDCIVELSTTRGTGRAEVTGCGLKGDTGPAGPRGPTGLTGARGPVGPEGPEGPAGAKGSAGPAGPTGPKGATGAAGPTGATGPQGLTGATGATGPAGATGATGATGPAGSTGPTGPAGSGGALFAVVTATGAWSRGYPSGVGYESTQLATGQYEVLFGTTDITECAFLATVGSEIHSGGYTPGFIIVVGRAGEPSGVYLETYNTSGVAADRGFHLAVTCEPED